MALAITASPGKVFTSGEKVTTAKLNQLAAIVLSLSGTVETSDLAPGAVTPAKVAPGAFWVGADAGSAANVYVCTFTPAVTAIADGMMVLFKATASNTGASTFKADGLDPKQILREGQALQAGDIVAGQVVLLVGNTTVVSGGCWELVTQGQDRPVREYEGCSDYLDGLAGAVPAAKAGQGGKVLKGNGTWGDLNSDIDARIAVALATINVLPMWAECR